MGFSSLRGVPIGSLLTTLPVHHPLVTLTLTAVWTLGPSAREICL